MTRARTVQLWMPPTFDIAFAPYELEGGWMDAARDGLGEAVLGQLERHVPDLRERIVAMEVLTPVDLQRRYRTTGGHLHHGEHALDQMLFMRPTPETAHYRTPIRGLFLAGSGSHPLLGEIGPQIACSDENKRTAKPVADQRYRCPREQ